MFTGLVQDVGRVEAVERTAAGARLRIATRLAPEIEPGDSVAVNGCCLTATSSDAEGFACEVMNQTLEVTSLGPVERGADVNLELALRAADRLGGHLVQGHVDTTGTVGAVEADGFASRVRVEVPERWRRYLAERGSVAIDGVSLTVASLTDDGFEVSLIPETLERTTLGALGPGSVVNLEADVLARYVERLLATPDAPGAGERD